jgi:SAM-dependent methyltransferase
VYSLQAAHALMSMLPAPLESGCKLLELGAGSGRFTSVFLKALRSYAVGPDAYLATDPSNMVEQIQSPDDGFLERAFAAAAAIPVQTGSMDAVIAAQSFHWFADEDGIDEIHRVLRPGAPLLVYYNIRNPVTPALMDLEDLITDAYPPDSPRAQTREWVQSLQESGRFRQTASRQLRSKWGGDLATCVKAVMSISGIASRGESDRAEIQHEVRRLLKRAGAGSSTEGPLEFPCTEELWVFSS